MSEKINCFECLEYEPSSEPLSAPEAHHTANVTCSAAVKLDTQITRQMYSDSSGDELLNKSTKQTLFDHSINQNCTSNMNYAAFELHAAFPFRPSKALRYVTSHSCYSVRSQC